MNFFSRMVLRWLERSYLRQERKEFPFTLPLWNRNSEIPLEFNYQSYAGEGYAKNSVVYSCIRKIATTAPAAFLRVEKIEDDRREEIVGHPLTDLFFHPNPITSSFEFQEILHTFLNLCGECYIVKSVDPFELWFARPDRMFPIPGVKKLLGFIYIGEDQKRTPFLLDEVIHIKYPNPLDRWEGFGRGLSPLSAAAIETDVDNKATGYLRDFFYNAAVPFGLLKSKQILDEPRIQLIRDRLKSQYTGERKWHEIMILDADAEYQKMGLGMDEIALPEIRFLSESRICAVFDVPPILVGVQVGLKNEQGFTSSIGEARRALWFDKIIPDNVRIAEAFNTAFRDRLDEDEFVSHDYSEVVALQEDRTAKFLRANQGYLGGWITRNEARGEVGFPPVSGGDDFFERPVVTSLPSGLIDGKDNRNGRKRDVVWYE